jgi:dolichol kinase
MSKYKEMLNKFKYNYTLSAIVCIIILIINIIKTPFQALQLLYLLIIIYALNGVIDIWRNQ